MADEKNLKKGKIRTFIEDVLLHKDEPHQEPSPEAKRRRKKGIIISCILVAILIAVIIGVCIPVIRFLQATDSATLRDYVHQEGWKAILIFFLINILQTMTTVVPDGPFEIASGAVFGVGLGTLINDLAVTAGSLVAFTLSRLFGMRFVTLFVDEEKIRSHNLTHVNSHPTGSALHQLIFCSLFHELIHGHLFLLCCSSHTSVKVRIKPQQHLS